MNYEEMENLALLSKEGDASAKEQLMKEFTPFILNLVSRTYVKGYESQDLKNECYATLFKSVEVYNPNNHRFTAYAINAMKNSINNLIRNSIRRSLKEDPRINLSGDNLDCDSFYGKDFVEDNLCKSEFNSEVKAAINSLSEEEKNLLNYVFFRNYTLIEYSKLRGISYRKAFYMKVKVLSKLKTLLNNEIYYRN